MSILPRVTGISSSAIFLLRVILLLAAAALAVAGFVLTSRGESGSGAATERYECPMHAEVSGAAPGQCPICKMALERRDHAAHGTSAAPEDAPNARRDYSCPMHPEVRGKAPGKCPICGMALRPSPAPKPSAPQANVIPVSSIYAPGVTWLPETFPPAARSKPEQGPATAAVKRRDFVQDVRAPAWLEASDRLAAVLYKDELLGLWSEARGAFYRALAPRAAVEVRPSDEPPTPWDASTSLVRFIVEPGATGDLRAGDTGWLVLPPSSRELLVFPESALLRSSRGPYVLVPGADGHGFSRRPVQVGRILKGQVVVLSGLYEGDRVVVGNAFFLDAERQPEPRAEPFAGVGR